MVLVIIVQGNHVAVKYEDYVSDGCSGHTYYIEVPDYVYKKKPGRYTTNPVVTACSSTVTWNHC